MLAIINCVIVMRDHLIPDGVITTENGTIRDFGEERIVSVPDGAEICDAGGLFAGPGLIDIHTHAGGGKYFCEDPVFACGYLLSHGVTSVLPALYFNMNRQGYLDAIDTIDRAVASGNCPNFAGYYMEGPYLNPKFGADRENNPWQGKIDRGDYAAIIERVLSTARVWALAPEREGISSFAADVRSAIPDIVLSVGHSEASPDEIELLIPYGLKLATHHTNATGSLPKYPECRGVCVDETVNYHDDIYAELIADSRGIHVAPYMLRLIEKIKGKDKIILISDTCVFGGAVPDGYDGVTDINFDRSGEIAGSKLTLDKACRNMMVHTGCSLTDLFRYASLNPARLLRLGHKGEIKRGSDADIILCDNWMNVKSVFLKGEKVQ